MRQAGLAVELLATRHVRNALEDNAGEDYRNGARGIGQLMRFRRVHCKSIAAQETTRTAHRAQVGAGKTS